MFEFLSTEYADILYWTGLIVPILHAIGLLNALDAVQNMRSPQGGVAWVITLILFPYIALPAYWVFGPRRFMSYKKKILNSRKSFRNVYQQDKQRNDSQKLNISFERSEEIKFFEKIADSSLTTGNKIVFHTKGEEFFNDLSESIENAKDYIIMQYYIIRCDETGKALSTLLKKKASQGVRVYLLYDQIGCWGLSRSYVTDLAAHGINVKEFKTNRGFKNRFRLNFRNHRKIMIVDGKDAFIGGHNIGNEYIHGSKSLGEVRDTTAQIQGPAVATLQRSFAQDWFWITDDILDLSWHTTTYEENIPLLPVATGPVDEIENCSLYILNLIRLAKKSIWFSTPYFVPDVTIISALQMAALRGLEVCIIIPSKSDLRIAQLATKASCRDLISAGVKIYEYKKGFIHQKVFIIDDTFASIGSVNIDNRSLRLNFEQSVLVPDKETVETLRNIFTADLKDSEFISESLNNVPFFARITQQVAKLFSPLL